MPTPSRQKIAKRELMAHARDSSLRNKHEEQIMQLNEKLSGATADLHNCQQKNLTLITQIQTSKEVEKDLEKKLFDKTEESNRYRNKWSECKAEKVEIERKLLAAEDQIVLLRRKVFEAQDAKEDSEKQLKLELQNLKISRSNVVHDAIIHQKTVSDRLYEKRIRALKSKITQLLTQHPFRNVKMKSYSRKLDRKTKKKRFRILLEWIKTTIGADYDDFLTELCREIAKDPKFTFKTALNDMDSFLAVVKWKLSDTFLREFKAFITSKLGFDVFSSREKIANLRKRYSNLDQYDIIAKTIMKKRGSRDVEVESTVIRAKDVTGLIRQRVERLHSNGKLSFSSPDDVITLGVGGDKGGQHTKLVVSFGDTDAPNNPHGLLLLGMYEASDDYNGLSEHMLPVLQMINDIEELTYMEDGEEVTRKISKIPVGDCKFLSAILGHAGQSSSTPCFVCKLKWTCKGSSAARVGTFDFSQTGPLYDANDLKTPLLSFHSHSICPPSLHIILGIVQKYIINWFLGLCNKIDCGDEELPEDLLLQKKTLKELKDEEEYYESRLSHSRSSLAFIETLLEVVQKSITTGSGTIGNTAACASVFCVIAGSKRNINVNTDTFFCKTCNSFVHHACSFHINREEEDAPEKCFDCEQKKKKKSGGVLENRLHYLQILQSEFQNTVNGDMEVYSEVFEERMKLEDALKENIGDMRKTFEKALRSVGCDTRTWYQQLTGNQARNLLRPQNFMRVAAVFPAEFAEKLEIMEQLVEDLSTIMSSAKNKEHSDEEINVLASAIKNFEVNLKFLQPQATVSTKLHVLCAHLIPYLRIHRSWGTVNEQGQEHLHAVINSLIVRIASVRSPIQKSSIIVKTMSNYNFLFDTGSSWFKVPE